jgi:uncharacterized protein YdaT
MFEKSEVERCEHHDESNIRRQPLPESISEKEQVHTDNDGHHRRHVKQDSYLSAHFSPQFKRKSISAQERVLDGLVSQRPTRQDFCI